MPAVQENAAQRPGETRADVLSPPALGAPPAPFLGKAGIQRRMLCAWGPICWASGPLRDGSKSG